MPWCHSYTVANAVQILTDATELELELELELVLRIVKFQETRQEIVYGVSKENMEWYMEICADLSDHIVPLSNNGLVPMALHR